MTINQAKEMDMVDYLSGLGYKPERISGKSYWYLSPLHDEKTASFKINRQLNRWYDFAEGKGGNLVDFGILFYHCSVIDFLQRVNGQSIFIQQNQKFIRQEESKPEVENNLRILSTHKLSSYPLMKYLQNRRIDNKIADKYCQEIGYQVAGKVYYAIGFKNDSGGYELRNPNFKGSSSPKGITFIDIGSSDIAVFEGFFNFLSYHSIFDKLEQPSSNFLILNSASFFEKSLPKMQEHRRVHLFLDNDKTGQRYTLLALSLNREKFIDERRLYQQYNDLNDWIMHIGMSPKHEFRHKF
ncbi:MAG TPA: toprim domain-containing protein [Puia sp.]|nr:toprim domain-containing protein [Puia sp.]